MNRKVHAHLALSLIVLLNINFSFGQIAKGAYPSVFLKNGCTTNLPLKCQTQLGADR
jgi:hypothetical protein